MSDILCVYLDCQNTRRTRGLCHQHYQTMRSYVRLGRADEADLMRRGLLLPEGQGGSPVKDHAAFLKGSKIEGRAKRKYGAEIKTEPLTECAAKGYPNDVECVDKRCPQERDGEPAKTGRDCPLALNNLDDDDA